MPDILTRTMSIFNYDLQREVLKLINFRLNFKKMVTLLRTLTLKSRLKFGKFGDYTVKDIFTKKKQDYLAWAYYNLSKITFIDSVLNEIGIDKKERIEKPGTNKELGKTVIPRCKITLALSDHTLKLLDGKRVKRAEQRLNSMRFGIYSKGGMARRNRGH